MHTYPSGGVLVAMPGNINAGFHHHHHGAGGIGLVEEMDSDNDNDDFAGVPGPGNTYYTMVLYGMFTDF